MVINQPSAFVSSVEYALGEGTQTITIDQFTTDEPINCPIEGYQATNLESGIIASSLCPISGLSDSCRDVVVDLAVEATYEIKFKVKAK